MEGELEKFELVPKEEFREIFEVLQIDSVTFDGEALTIKPRTPQGRGCGPFTGKCRGDLFFDKVNIAK